MRKPARGGTPPVPALHAGYAAPSRRLSLHPMGYDDELQSSMRQSRKKTSCQGSTSSGFSSSRGSGLEVFVSGLDTRQVKEHIPTVIRSK